jgi:hypothetical protein
MQNKGTAPTKFCTALKLSSSAAWLQIRLHTKTPRAQLQAKHFYYHQTNQARSSPISVGAGTYCHFAVKLVGTVPWCDTHYLLHAVLSCSAHPSETPTYQPYTRLNLIMPNGKQHTTCYASPKESTEGLPTTPMISLQRTCSNNAGMASREKRQQMYILWQHELPQDVNQSSSWQHIRYLPHL